MSPLEEKVDHLIHLVEEQAFELQTVKQIVFELLNEDEKSYNDKERNIRSSVFSVIVSRVFDPLSADVAEMIESSTKAHMIGCNENAVQYAIKKAKAFFTQTTTNWTRINVSYWAPVFEQLEALKEAESLSMTEERVQLLQAVCNRLTKAAKSNRVAVPTDLAHLVKVNSLQWWQFCQSYLNRDKNEDFDPKVHLPFVGRVRPVSPRKAVDGFGSGSGSGSGSGFDSGISTGYGSADLYEVIDVSEGSTSPKKRHIKY